MKRFPQLDKHRFAERRPLVQILAEPTLRVLKQLRSKYCLCNEVNFQRVKATGDLAPRTGDNPLKTHQQSTEREERILTVTIHF